MTNPLGRDIQQDEIVIVAYPRGTASWHSPFKCTGGDGMSAHKTGKEILGAYFTDIYQLVRISSDQIMVGKTLIYQNDFSMVQPPKTVKGRLGKAVPAFDTPKKPDPTQRVKRVITLEDEE